MSRPLDGTLVVALEQAVAAPYATSRLADAGARVIKVERAEGDFARHYDHVVHGESAHFVWLNRGKESLVADIKDPDDQALIHRILARADVFVLNLAPGAAARARLAPAEMRAANPRLITCEISGYGDDNRYRDMKAYDLLVQSEVGLVSITGTPEGMGRVGVSVADIAAGMHAENAILRALIERGRTGAGTEIKVSLFDALADWMAVPLLYHDYAGRQMARIGVAHPMIAPYGLFHCRDGDIVIAVQNEREWRALCAEVLGRPELIEDPRFENNVRRVASRAALGTEIQAVLGASSVAEVEAKLTASRIAFGRVNDVAGLSAHPALHRVRVDTPTGPAEVPAPPAVESAGRLSLRPVPALGAHSASIRREFET